MPIQYRCPECDTVLSISRRMAGTVAPCPRCGVEAVVPEADSFEAPSSGIAEPVVTARESAAPSPQPRVPVSAALSTVKAPADEPPAAKAEPQPNGASAGGFSLRKRSLGAEEEMDLTPMVDMTFLLLIFFMITASFQIQKSLEMPNPGNDKKGAAQAVTLDSLEDKSVMVSVDERNRVFVEDRPVADVSQLANVLSRTIRTTRKNELLITADEQAYHETVVRVIDAAQEAGAQKIRMLGSSRR